MDVFDVLIVGAGIGGSICAYELCRKGKRVILLEQYPGYPPSKDSLVTRSELIERFSLPEKVIQNKGNKLSYRTYPELEGASFTAREIGIEDPVVLNCNRLISHCIDNAVKQGCIFKINESVGKIVRGPEGYCVTLSSETYSCVARLIVDASGSSCVIGKKLGVFRQRKPVGYCQIILTKGDKLIDPNEAFFDVESFSRWYWIYPVSSARAYAGLYSFGKEELFGRFVEDITAYLKRQHREYIKHYNVEYEHSFLNMFSPITTGKIIEDRVIFLGESGGTTTPLLGEGFRPICTIVSWLSDHIDAVLSGNCSLEELNKHFFETAGRYYSLVRALLPVLLELDHEASRRIMVEYLLKLPPQKLYAFTTLQMELSDWKELVAHCLAVVPLRQRVSLVFRSPMVAMRLIGTLEKEGILDSPFQLLK